MGESRRVWLPSLGEGEWAVPPGLGCLLRGGGHGGRLAAGGGGPQSPLHPRQGRSVGPAPGLGLRGRIQSEGSPGVGPASPPSPRGDASGASQPRRCPGVTAQSSSAPGAASSPVLPKSVNVKMGEIRGEICTGGLPGSPWEQAARGSPASRLSLPSPRPAAVSVTCGHAWLSVAVPAGLLGSRVASGELMLGSSCGVTAVNGDGYRLEHPLVGCGTTLEVRSRGEHVSVTEVLWQRGPPRGGRRMEAGRPCPTGEGQHQGTLGRDCRSPRGWEGNGVGQA